MVDLKSFSFCNTVLYFHSFKLSKFLGEAGLNIPRIVFTFLDGLYLWIHDFYAIQVVYVDLFDQEMTQTRKSLGVALKFFFVEFGPIASVCLKPKNKRKLPSHALVTFFNQDEGQNAIDELNSRVESMAFARGTTTGKGVRNFISAPSHPTTRSTTSALPRLYSQNFCFPYCTFLYFCLRV